MIEYVLATEFDNKLGTCIVATYPERGGSEQDQLLGDYLMPDGMHRMDRDSYVFRSVLAIPISEVEKEVEAFNKLEAKANLYIFKANQRNIYDTADSSPGQASFTIDIVQMKFLRLSYNRNGAPKTKLFVLHPETIIKQLSDRLYSIRSEDDTVFLLEFQSKSEGVALHTLAHTLLYNLTLKRYLSIDPPGVVLKSGWFYCYCSNKKDPSAERGTIYRSVALFSSKVNIFEFFRQAVSRTMEIYQTFSPRPTWTEYERESIRNSIRYLYQECNNMASPEEEISLKIENTSLINPTIAKDLLINHGFGPQRVKVYPRLFGASSKVLIDQFGLGVMVLYRAILAENSIVFFGDKLKVENICSIVTSTLHLVCPLNIVSKIYPFEHIQSIEIIKNTRGFIAGYTNPIVKNQKLLNWNYFVDIATNTIYDTSMKPSIVRNENDKIFFEAVQRRIREDMLDEHEVDAMFFEYTKTNLDVMLNKSNVIRFDKEEEMTMQNIFQLSDSFKQTTFFDYLDIQMKNEREEFQGVFGNKYLGVYQAYKLFTESDRFEDMDLLVAYDALRVAITDREKADFFMKKVGDKLADLDVLTLGLMSEDENVRSSCNKVITQLEASLIWEEVSSSAGLFKSILLSESPSGRNQAPK